MSRIQDHIDVSVPISTVYNQWTQFEDFPKFMDGVDRVVQLDETTLEWTATIAGKTKSWKAKITEQEPDRRIAWTAIDGAMNAGIVTFESLGGSSTRVDLTLEVEPEGATEKIGDAMGLVKGQVKGDLERFREFIESRGSETGAWRGEVVGGRETSR